MGIRKAVDALVAHVGGEGETIHYGSERRRRFDELDRAVWVEAEKLRIADHLPQSEGLGRTKLPGDTLVSGDYVPMSARSWAEELRDVVALAEAEPARGPAKQEDAPPRPVVTVDLKRMVLSIDGRTYAVDSALALRWVKVLTERPGHWVSASDLRKHDPELEGARPDKFKKKLPDAILSHIDSDRRKGSRFSPTA